MTAVAYETEQMESWAAEYRAGYKHTVEDVLDAGKGYREKERAHVLTRDAREQDLIARQRTALSTLAKAEQATVEAYTEFGAELQSFVEAVEQLTSMRRTYDAAWKSAHALGEVPVLLPSIPLQSVRDTETAYDLRRLLDRFRLATAPLP